MRGCHPPVVENEGKRSMQRLCGTGLRAFVAENALRPVFSPARLLVDCYIHRADARTLAAVDAFALVAVDTQQRKITHWLEKHRNGTQVFTEGAIILERKGQRNACNVIKCVSGEEHPKHDLLQMRDLHQK